MLFPLMCVGFVSSKTPNTRYLISKAPVYNHKIISRPGFAWDESVMHKQDHLAKIQDTYMSCIVSKDDCLDECLSFYRVKVQKVGNRVFNLLSIHTNWPVHLWQGVTILISHFQQGFMRNTLNRSLSCISTSVNCAMMANRCA